MKISKNLLLVALLGGLAVTSRVQADETGRPGSVPLAATNAEAKSKPYPLEFCLVSDEKFEGSDMKPFELVHEGQTIKFCCKSCVKDFKKEPKKYLAKLASEVKKLEAAKKK